jgi:hypothetical protein
MFKTSVCAIVCDITFWVKPSNCFLEGSYPWISRKATYKKLECSANCSIGYPLYSRTPLSPSI